jgi:hypothetical protein
LAHNENLKAHRAIYKKYKSLAPKTGPAALNSLNPFTKNKATKEQVAATKKQDAFYEKHAEEIEARQKEISELQRQIGTLVCIFSGKSIIRAFAHQI